MPGSGTAVGGVAAMELENWPAPPPDMVAVSTPVSENGLPSVLSNRPEAVPVLNVVPLKSASWGPSVKSVSPSGLLSLSA